MAIDLLECRADLLLARGQVERLRMALATHGSHGAGCNKAWARANGLDGPCDCGLDAVLAAHDAERPAAEGK